MIPAQKNTYFETITGLMILSSLFFCFSFFNELGENYYFFLEHKGITRKLDACLILRQYKINLTSRLMEMKSRNPKLTQKQMGKELSYSDST